MLRRRPTFLSFLLSVPLLAQGVEFVPVGADGAGCDVAKLHAAAQVIEAAVAADKICGAVVMVVRGHTVVLHEAYGARDVAGQKRMQKDTIFRMASNTKAVTAAAILTLVDEGKIGLDDPVQRWLPTWSEGDAGKITVRQLLTHSSGLRIKTLFVRPLMVKSERHPDAPNLVLECARFGEIGPKVTPGTTYSYSNPGYNTLAALVEVVSGQGFEGYCDEHFYKPLGMRDTCNHESRADNERMSVVVRGRSNGRWVARWSPGDEATLPFVRGSGGLISTAPDFARFCRMLLDGGQVGRARLLTRESVGAAIRNQIQHIEGGRYGFGWRIDGQGTFSHGGSDGTFAWCDPARDLIGIIFTQTQRSQGLRTAARSFREQVSQACPPVQPAVAKPK